MTAAYNDPSNSDGGVKSVVDLRARFGTRYRIEHDPAYGAEDRRSAKAEEVWLQLIPGRLGHIFPWGGELLGVSTACRGPAANRLAALSYIKIHADGDDGLTATFHLDHFREVARIIRARTTRRLSDAQRRALIDAGSAFRFKEHEKVIDDLNRDSKADNHLDNNEA